VDYSEAGRIICLAGYPKTTFYLKFQYGEFDFYFIDNLIAPSSEFSFLKIKPCPIS
jgi:hypothetical protein